MASQRKTTRFRELLQRPELLVIPGGFSPLLAKMAEVAGFEAFFLAGSQASAFLYGLPDAATQSSVKGFMLGTATRTPKRWPSTPRARARGTRPSSSRSSRVRTRGRRRLVSTPSSRLG